MKKQKNRKIAKAESNILRELKSRILSIENGTTTLIKPDWQKILNVASKIE